MGSALAQMKQEWRAFKQDDAGERFTHHRERMENRSQAFKIGSLVLGIVLLVGGVVLCVLPGPGLLLIIFGLALVAARSSHLTKILDAIEPRLRTWGRAIARKWRAMSTAGKVSVIAAIALLAVAGMTFMWHFVVSAYLLE